MSKRRAAAVALAVLALLAAGLGTRLLLRSPRCDLAAYDRVHHGMTLVEVSAAIGGPPRDYTEGAWDFEGEADFHLRRSRSDRVEKWIGARGLIVVFFDKNGEAVDKGFFPH